MRINFTNIQVNQEKEISKAQTAEKKEIRAAAVFAENPFSATQTKQGIYDKQGKTMEDIQACGYCLFKRLYDSHGKYHVCG